MIKKKIWSKPECSKVKLLPEEAIITGCKVTGLNGPGYIGNCGPGNACKKTAS